MNYDTMKILCIFIRIFFSRCISMRIVFIVFAAAAAAAAFLLCILLLSRSRDVLRHFVRETASRTYNNKIWT